MLRKQAVEPVPATAENGDGTQGGRQGTVSRAWGRDMKSHAKSDASRVVHVSHYCRLCATRERARKFYPELVRLLFDAPSWGEIEISFAEVEFVSPSFLDETVIRLAEEHAAIASRILISELSSFAAKRLQTMLKARDLSWTLTPRSRDGAYSLTS